MNLDNCNILHSGRCLHGIDFYHIKSIARDKFWKTVNDTGIINFFLQIY